MDSSKLGTRSLFLTTRTNVRQMRRTAADSTKRPLGVKVTLGGKQLSKKSLELSCEDGESDGAEEGKAQSVLGLTTWLRLHAAPRRLHCLGGPRGKAFVLIIFVGFYGLVMMRHSAPFPQKSQYSKAASQLRSSPCSSNDLLLVLSLSLLLWTLNVSSAADVTGGAFNNTASR